MRRRPPLPLMSAAIRGAIIGAIDAFLDIDRSGLSFIGWRFGYRKTVSLTDGCTDVGEAYVRHTRAARTPTGFGHITSSV
jgi:hypothetical protein